MRLQWRKQKDARTGQMGITTSVDAYNILNENRRNTSLLRFPILGIISCENFQGSINLNTVPLLEPPRNHLLTGPHLSGLQVFPHVNMFAK